MAGRTVAIGDIHGCATALTVLLEAISPDPDDTIITLGDYFDRGPNSCAVLDTLVVLASRCRLVALLGNHEQALLDAMHDRNAMRRWLTLGGADTLRSYGWTPGGPRRALADWIPKPHHEFISACQASYETETHIFVHAGYLPNLPLREQPELALRWPVADAATAAPHCSGKVAVVGHTPQRSGEILDLGFLLCIDTNCARGGWLTALDTATGQVWQSDDAGKMKESRIRSSG